MGLVALLAVVLYLALLVGATIASYYFGVKRGWPLAWRRLVATGAFLLIFLPMFWDWLPTVWLHSHYCGEYAGLSVYQTPRQWTEANPEIARKLVRANPPIQVGHGDRFYFQLNERLRWEIEHMEKALWLREDQERIVDGKTGEILVRLIDFSTGHSVRGIEHFRDIKVWMYRESCEPQGTFASRRTFSKFAQEFENIGDQR